MKVRAKEVPYDLRTSIFPWDYDDALENITVFGNHFTISHYPEKLYPLIKFITEGNYLPEIVDAVEYDEEEPIKVCMSYLEDYFPEYVKDCDELYYERVYQMIFKYTEGDVEISEVISAITGKNFIRRAIHGSSQSDWVEIMYDADEYPQSLIEEFTAIYFGDYSEFEVEIENGDTYFIFVFKDPKAEIAAAECCDEKDVEIRLFKGYKRVPEWEDAE